MGIKLLSSGHGCRRASFFGLSYAKRVFVKPTNAACERTAGDRSTEDRLPRAPARNRVDLVRVKYRCTLRNGEGAVRFTIWEFHAAC